MMNCRILGEKEESHFPGYLQHGLSRSQVSQPSVGLECQYLPLFAVANWRWYLVGRYLCTLKSRLAALSSLAGR